VRARVLRWLARAGYLEQAVPRDMASWEHGGGFSLDAALRIQRHDHAGWSGCCAIAPTYPWPRSGLSRLGDDELIYRFRKSRPTGAQSCPLCRWD
jgi:hypothetical protein